MVLLPSIQNRSLVPCTIKKPKWQDVAWTVVEDDGINGGIKTFDFNGQLFVGNGDAISSGHATRTFCSDDHFPIFFGYRLSADQVKARSAVNNPSQKFFLNGEDQTV